MATDGTAAAAAAPAGPRLLILGGLGFIGRHTLKAAVESEAIASVRIADKMVPPMAFLTPEFKALIKHEGVDYVQADLSDPEHVRAAFNADKGAFDYVVCLAAETAYGAAEDAYSKTEALAAACGQAAVEGGVKKFVYVSTASVYKSNKTAAVESGKVDPWTTPAKHQLAAEEALRAISGLPLVVLRPAIVYGPHAVTGIMPRAVCAAAYTKLDEKMQFLWDSSMRLNTVHVRDVVKAIFHACTTLEADNIYNLADKTGTDQGKINAVLGELFGIKTGFHGKMLSNFARMAMNTAVDTANEKHLAPWTQLLREHSIEHTPLTPFLDIELLRNNQLSVDGSAVESTGFTYDVPEMTKDTVAEMVTAAIAAKRFPAVAAGLPAGGATAGGTAAGAGAGAGAGAAP